MRRWAPVAAIVMAGCGGGGPATPPDPARTTGTTTTQRKAERPPPGGRFVPRFLSPHDQRISTALRSDYSEFDEIATSAGRDIDRLSRAVVRGRRLPHTDVKSARGDVALLLQETREAVSDWHRVRNADFRAVLSPTIHGRRRVALDYRRFLEAMLAHDFRAVTAAYRSLQRGDRTLPRRQRRAVRRLRARVPFKQYAAIVIFAGSAGVPAPRDLKNVYLPRG